MAIGNSKENNKTATEIYKTPFVVVVVFNIGYGRTHISIITVSKYYENVIISLSDLYILTFIFLINLTGS